MKRSRFVITALLGVAAMLGAAACGGSSNPLGGGTSTSSGAPASAPSQSGGASGSSGAPGTSTEPASSGPIIVGSANFPENVLLAEIYAGALQAKGVQVTTKLNIGSRETYIPGLQDGSIDLIPEYTGNLLRYFDTNSTEVSSADVYAALGKQLPAGLIVLNQSAAQDKDAIVVTKATADKYHLKSIADLQPVAGQLALSAPPEFKTRKDGIPGLKRIYDVTFGTFLAQESGPLRVQALQSGHVQAADIFTTDPSIVQNGFIALQDPKNLFAAQNVVPLINKSKATDTVKDALNAVSAKLDTQTLAELDKKVIADKQDPDAVAKAWLSSAGLG